MSTIKTFSQVVGKTFKTSYVPNDPAIVSVNCEFTIHAVSASHVSFRDDYTGETHDFAIIDPSEMIGFVEAIDLGNGDHSLGRVYASQFK